MVGSRRALKTTVFLGVLLAAAVAVFRYDVANLQSANADKDLRWKLDRKYSAELTIMANPTTMDAATDPMYKTSKLRIYAGDTGGNIMPFYLSEIFEKKMLYETDDKRTVAKFIGAARQEVSGDFDVTLPNCDRLYFVMLNDEETLAGYFLFYKCADGEKSVGMVRPYQYGESSSTYYNTSLLALIADNVPAQ